jgi:hypothetical protein
MNTSNILSSKEDLFLALFQNGPSKIFAIVFTIVSNPLAVLILLSSKK